MKLVKVFFIILTLFITHSIHAQKHPDFNSTVVDSTKLQQITLKDGSIIFGHIISKTNEGIVVKTKHTGIINLVWADIDEIDIDILENKNSGQAWFKNANETRYVIGPTAIPLKKKSGYYQNTYILLNSFNYGITDHISIGGGFEILSLFIRGNASFNFFLTPKVGFKVSEKLHLGAGVLHINLRDFNRDGAHNRQNFNIFYGSITYGTAEHNLTLSSGYTYNNYTEYTPHYEERPVYDSFGNVLYYDSYYYETSERKHEFSKLPIVTFSAMTRVGKKLSLITENWIVPSRGGMYYYGCFSYGIRLLGNKTSFDLGFINNRDLADVLFIGIPYANFVVKF